MTEYQKIYEEVWSHDEYRRVNHGLNLWLNRRELFPDTFKSVIDIGCGNGALVEKLLKDGFDAYGVDVAENSVEIGSDIMDRIGWKSIVDKWCGDDVEAVDLGICCDVMEHIDEGDVVAALTNIWSICNEVVFVIANYPSNFLGYNLHPTKKEAWWWCEKMRGVDPDSWVYLHKLDRPGRAGEVFCIKWKRG